MIYNTVVLKNDDAGISEAAALLRTGEVVAIPTETVYGLAANALDTTAVSHIFEAKGRPSDNPLIVHISELSQLNALTSSIPDEALMLANSLMPAPLTLVLPKSPSIPFVTSGGLDTVGIRMPANETARRIISECGFPLAAPSANRSGYPSPTTAMHVYRDMTGRIPAIVDGGACSVGIESTVVSFDEDGTVRILRPGFITKEDLLHIVPRVVIDKNVLSEPDANERVASPGMKYTHYSPKAEVFLVAGGYAAFTAFMHKNAGHGDFALVFDADAKGDAPIFPYLTYGDGAIESARVVFARLRELDDLGAHRVFVRCPEKQGVGLAVYNRLIRAAGFKLIDNINLDFSGR